MGQTDEALAVEIEGKALLTLFELGVGAVRAQTDVQQAIEFLRAFVDDLDELSQHGLLGVPAVRHEDQQRRLLGRQRENDFARFALAA